MTTLAPPVAARAAQLAELPRVEAVVLGGSRATGTASIAVAVLSRYVDGHVSRPGEWGPLINGGAWLTVDGIVEQRLADARAAPLRPR